MQKLVSPSETVMSTLENIGTRKAQYQQEPLPIIDCNNCEHISITEMNQRKQGNHNPHICQRYKKQCKHNSMERNAVFIYLCKECVADKFKNFRGGNLMTLVEFAEKTSPIPLSEWQKQFLSKYEQAQKENKQLLVIHSRNTGREMALQIIDTWKNGGELAEHRCSCGRLLGRFNGQAEVKCPKCGKMNVIGDGDK